MKRILPILFIFILVLGCEKHRVPEIEEIKIISQGYNTKHKGVDLYILQNFTDEEITITVFAPSLVLFSSHLTNEIILFPPILYRIFK